MPDAPGPPGLKTSAPCRDTTARPDFPVASTRLTVSRICLPSGWA